MKIPKILNPYEQRTFSRRLVSFFAFSGAVFVICVALMVVLSALAGCSLPPSGQAGTALNCPPSERFLRVYVDVHREQNVVNDPQADIDVHAPFIGTVQALSPAPGFQGVAFFTQSPSGAGVVSNIGTVTPGNPLTFEGQSPFVGAACWPAENPVAFLFRATVIPKAADVHAEDEVLCTMDDGHVANGLNEGELVNSDYHRVELVDLIPGNTAQVQCVDYYVPGTWDGAPLPTFNPLPRS
jgi:hypothetical protein